MLLLQKTNHHCEVTNLFAKSPKLPSFPHVPPDHPTAPLDNMKLSQWPSDCGYERIFIARVRSRTFPHARPETSSRTEEMSAEKNCQPRENGSKLSGKPRDQ
jgi:hypothetical protein